MAPQVPVRRQCAFCKEQQWVIKGRSRGQWKSARARNWAALLGGLRVIVAKIDFCEFCESTARGGLPAQKYGINGFLSLAADFAVSQILGWRTLLTA